MNRRLASIARRALLAAMFFAAIAGVVAACKQQEGERCQLDSDCETGLQCNEASQRCESGNALDPIDATVPDIIPDDAAIDAPDDVMPDA
ncbi:MAG: hypothetical protein AB7T06_20265 [Kofleriaceae bacterium]